MSTLKVDTIQGKTTAGTVAIPNHVIQAQYVTNTDQGVSNISGQTSLTVNNAITRGTLSTTFARKNANSFFLVELGVTSYRPTTAGELRIGYRVNSGSDVLAYVQDSVNWVSNTKVFKDTTTGSLGDSMTFESVYQNTASTNNTIRYIYMNILEIAQ
tara:strand:+ start:366 stop:836 length:471 start_codon:yes stop_codon:yes gene_type:complete